MLDGRREEKKLKEMNAKGRKGETRKDTSGNSGEGKTKRKKK